MTNDYRSRIMPARRGARRGRNPASASTSTTAAPSPSNWCKALTRRGPELHDVEVLHMATMGIADYSLPEYEGHFRHNALFIGGNVRTGRAGRPRRLHPHLPERDRRPVHAPARCPSTCACCNARRPTTTAT